MYRKPSKRKQTIRLVFVYSVMVTAVILVAAFVTMAMLGYRFNTADQDLERLALLQFSSVPSGATVSIDGDVIGSKTPNKTSVAPGRHDFVFWREGYETWRKTVNIKSAATVTWLNYALLVPSKLTLEPVANYSSLTSTLAAFDEDKILVQKQPNVPIFDLVNVRPDKIETTALTLPAVSYSVGSVHNFRLNKWDEGARYVLIDHTYDGKHEWLMLDTQDVNSSKNISKTFGVTVDDIVFSGTGGNRFYVLSAGNLHFLNLSNNAVSSSLASGVTSFGIYPKSNVVTYVGAGTNTNEKVVGIYREGDERSAVIKTVSSTVSPLVATTKYFNDNYIAISEGKKVTILSGSYPNTTSDDANSLREFTSFTTAQDVKRLEFSPIGQYVLVQNGAYFASFDMEYQNFMESQIPGSGTVDSLRWLDENYLWSDRDGQLQIFEYDGANAHSINSVQTGQDVILTKNGRYLYSLGKTSIGYDLQRVRMILP